MTANRLQSRVDEAWNVIDAAIKNGLGPPGKREADKICPAVALPSTTWRRDAPGTVERWHKAPKSSGAKVPPEVDRLQRAGRDYFGVTHRFALDLRELEALAADDPDLMTNLTSWAGRAADFQSAMSLQHLVSRGTPAELKPTDKAGVEQTPLAQQLTLWAADEPSRCDAGYRLVLTSGDKVQNALLAWIADQVAPSVSGYDLGCSAVLIPTNEPGTIREQAFDLILTWEPTSRAKGSLDLVLEERLAFRDPRNEQGVPILFG